MREGMAGAFDNLYKAYSHKLYSFALTFLKSREDAEEVVQDTYFKIWEKRNSIDSNQSFSSFLFSIGYHSTIDLLRQRLKEENLRASSLKKLFPISIWKRQSNLGICWNMSTILLRSCHQGNWKFIGSAG